MSVVDTLMKIVGIGSTALGAAAKAGCEPCAVASEIVDTALELLSVEERVALLSSRLDAAAIQRAETAADAAEDAKFPPPKGGP